MDLPEETAVKAHFDQYAASHRWQNLYEKSLSKDNVSFALRLDAYAELLRELNPASVLDLGCGSGDYLIAMPSARTRYHGVDISPEMIQSLNEKIAELPEDRRAVTTAEVAAISEMDVAKKYDFILASGFVEYFEDMEPVVKKMVELTTSGGYVATQVPNRLYRKHKGLRYWASSSKSFRHHRLTGEELDEVHEKAGLKKVRGFYIDHEYFPKSRKLSPALFQSLNRRFTYSTPAWFSRRYASGYIGLYRKP
jgi:predicted TPR repeat methyltransferase